MRPHIEFMNVLCVVGMKFKERMTMIVYENNEMVRGDVVAFHRRFESFIHGYDDEKGMLYTNELDNAQRFRNIGEGVRFVKKYSEYLNPKEIKVFRPYDPNR